MFFGNTLFKLFMEIEKRQRLLDFACDVIIKKPHDGDYLELEFIYYVGNQKRVLPRTLTKHELDRTRLSLGGYLDLFFDSVQQQRLVLVPKPVESDVRRLFIKGDGVGMIYAQPGNDTTSLLVLEDEEEGKDVHCWDIWFGLDIHIDREKLWLLSDNELDSTTYHHLYGSITCRDRIERTKKEKL